MLFLLVFVVLGLLGMIIGNLVNAVLEFDDLGGVLEHILLHLVEDNVLHMICVTLCSCSCSWMLVSSWICLILREWGSTIARWWLCAQ